eukprot:1971562-Alexandrium_andersonii.AAC.1
MAVAVPAGRFRSKGGAAAQGSALGDAGAAAPASRRATGASETSAVQAMAVAIPAGRFNGGAGSA